METPYYPPPPPPPQPRNNTTRNILIVVGILLGLCCLVVACAALGYFGIQYSNNQSASKASATAAAQSTAIAKYDFFEPFDNNNNDWGIGTDNNEFGTTFKRISNGTLIWGISDSKQEFISLVSYTKQDSYTDFDLSVDVKRNSGPESVCYGVVFRQAKGGFNGGGYIWNICENQSYTLVFYDQSSGWNTIINWTTIQAIRKGEWNRLNVQARGTHFVLSINNIQVGEFDDSRMKSGYVDLMINTFSLDTGEIWFDNFALQPR